MFYATTLSESQRVMRWKLIIEEFGTNIQHIYGVDNIVADTLIRLPYMLSDKYEPFTRKDQCCTNELFNIGRVENNEDCFPQNMLNVKIEQQKELININSQTKYISLGSGIWLLHISSQRC